MDKVVLGFLNRNLPNFVDKIKISLTGDKQDNYVVCAKDEKVYITANNYISAFSGFYDYLKKYCRVQLSWCGNREIKLDKLVMFDGELKKNIVQKYRVYLNYCTFDYSMCWWDFDKWEKEIDFMAMNGINMPLCIVGSEAVWYETLLDFGFSKEEALSTVSGPAFWAWHLMTNIDSYMPPKDESYITERLELGRKILNRYLEFGMQPIQQGFSGHVPMKLKEKYPNSNILAKKGWCYFPKTAQIDPLDPLFYDFGMKYLENLDKLFGNYHFIACDPFHEGTPPKQSRCYLKEVGKSINKLYEDFDKKSVWVMQGWTPRKHIIRAVPKGRLLILDLNSERTPKLKNFWGYFVVAGMLHNFGGKNAMQGQIRHHCDNAFKHLKDRGANVIGSGMFMEGIEQNPVVYDLQFHMLTESGKIDFSDWLDDYIERRYGKYSDVLRKAWDLMIETCYSDGGYRENEVGSTLAARPQPMPVMCGPCCYSKVWYDTKKLEKALSLFISVREEFKDSDGYQYDLCDLTRQVLSNRFHDRQNDFALNYKNKNLSEVKEIAKEQLDLMLDLDELLSHRSEMCLSRWICDSHNLAQNDDEKRYFDMNARTLITQWGDIDGDTSALYDYSWREWSGLIKEYYYVRWEMFYDEAISHMENGTKFDFTTGDNYEERKRYRKTDFGKKLNEFELSWCKTYSECEYPVDSDVVPSVLNIVQKWNIEN